MKAHKITTNLISFSATNYRSIKETATLSLVARKNAKNTFRNKILNESLLRSIVIFGANASGKSNLIRGMYFFTALIQAQTILYRDNFTETDPTPFLLDSGSRKDPTVFEINLSYGDMIFSYSAAFDNIKKSIAQEHLRVRNKSTTSFITVYKRDYNTLTISRYKGAHNFVHGISETHKKLLQVNTLFCTTLSKLAEKTVAHDFIAAINTIHAYNTLEHKPIDTLINALSEIEGSPVEGHTLKEIILGFLRAGDLSVNDLELRSENGERVVYVIHQFKEKNKIRREAFSYWEESRGTQKILDNVVPLIYSLTEGTPYVVDELDSMLHPTLLRFILRLFHKSNTNAQIVMTSHDVTLMDDRDLLTKEQIMFIERKMDLSSDLYGLADFGISNQARSFSKRYLHGEFGANPKIKEDLEL